VRDWVKALPERLPDVSQVEIAESVVNAVRQRFEERPEPEIFMELQVFLILAGRLAVIRRLLKEKRFDEASTLIRRLEMTGPAK